MPRNFGIRKPSRLVGHGSGQGAPDELIAIYDASLTGDSRYIAGDLVTLDASGKTTRSIQTTAANVTKLLEAGHSWVLDALPRTKAGAITPQHLGQLRNNRILGDSRWIMSYQHNSADGTPYAVTQADLDEIRSGSEKRELKFNANAVGKNYTVRDGSANPAVVILGLFDATTQVGDTDVPVIVQFLPSVLG